MLGALALAAYSAKANVVKWDGEGADLVWGTAANWFDSTGSINNVLPLAADDLEFGLSGPGTIDLGGNQSANSLRFSLNGFTLGTAATANTLTVGGAGGSILVDATVAAQINAFVAGANGLTKSGAGTLTLAGANAFTGTVAVNAGVLSVSADNNFGAVANGLSLAGGTISTGATFSSARGVALGTGGGTLDVTGPASLTLSGIVSGGTAFNKTGAGALVLSGANTNTGGLNVSGGSVSFSADNNLGGANNAINLSNGGGINYTATGAITFGAGRVVNVASGTSGVFGVVVGTPSITTSKVTVGAANQITGAGTFIKNGAGLLTLGGSNATFTGTWQVDGGALEVSPGALNSRPVQINGAGATGSSATTGELAVNGDLSQALTLNGGILSPSNGNRVFSGAVNVTANSSIALRDFYATGVARNATLTGPLTGGSNLAVTAGTTAATLSLSGNSSAFTGKVSIGANATVQPTTLTSIPTTGGFILAGGTLRNNVVNLVDTATVGSPGFNATYYNFGASLGSGDNRFATDLVLGNARVNSRNDALINVPDVGASGTYPISPVTGFAVGANNGAMWKGLLNVTAAGSYQFSGVNDDAAVLYIDGVQIGTLGVTGGATNTNIGSAVNLSAGLHSIVYKFTQGGGNGYTKLNYSGGDTGGSTVLVGTVANTVTNGSLAATDIGPVTINASSTMDFTVDSKSSGITLSGGTLTLTSPTISTYTVTGNSSITTNTTISPNTAALVMAGNVSGAGNLTFNGTYLATITGNNTFSGSTTVTNGEVDLNSSGTAIPGALTISATNAAPISNVRLLQSNQIADAATVTLSNTGVLDLGSNNDTVGSLVLQGGRVIGSGKLNATTLNLQNGTVLANLESTGGATKTTAGTVTLAGNNSIAGVIAVNAGVLNARGATALGLNGAGNGTTVVSGAALQLAGVNSVSEQLTINGNGVANDGALRNLAGTSSIGNLTLSGASLVSVDSGILRLNGTLDTTAGVLTKVGGGSLVFTSNLSSLPAVTLNGGSLGFSGPQSFGAVTVPAGRAFRFETDPGAGVSVTAPAGTAVISPSADNVLLSRLNAGSTGTLLLAADNGNALDFSTRNLTLGAIGLTRYSGALTPNAAGYRFATVAGQGFGQNELNVTSVLSGASALSVESGILQLSAANSFTGAIALSGGTTRIINNTALGNAANGVTLDGGTLQLNGTSGNAGQVWGQLGNAVNGGPRIITIGAAGGTIDVPAQTSGATGWGLMGNNSTSAAAGDPLAGTSSSVLTKTGLGFLFLLNATNYPGKIVIGSSGNQFDIRGNGRLLAANEVVVNSGGFFNVSGDSSLGSGRQTPTVTLADRVADSIPVTLLGGRLQFIGRNIAYADTGSREVFGATKLGIGWSEIRAERAGGGGTDMVISNLTRSIADHGTVRFTAGNTLGSTGDNGRILLTQVNGAAIADNTLLPAWATMGTNDFAVYRSQSANGGAGGVVQVGNTVIASTLGYTTLASATAPATGGFVAGSIGNASADVALGTAGAGQNFTVGALRLAGAATRAITFAGTTGTPDTLYIESGGILSDGNNNARNIGVTTNAFTRGRITAGATTASTPQELFLHNSSNTLTINSQIIDNPNNAAATVAVVKDQDGTVTLNATNTYTGGTYVLKGTLVANGVGSLGAGGVSIKNARLQMDVVGAVAPGTLITPTDAGDVNLNTAGDWATNGARYVITAGNGILGASSTTANLGLNSLTRVSGTPVNGGEVQLFPDAIVGHFSFRNDDLNGAGVNTIKNLGTAADLYYGLSLNNTQFNSSVTLGAGTPWKGLSTDRANRSWANGTIIANSDFYLQGSLADGSYRALTLGAPGSSTNPVGTGSYAIANYAGTAINAFVQGNVILAEDSAVSMPSDLTFVVTPGALLQPNLSNSFGSNSGNLNARVLIQAGGTLDPGNFVSVGAAANQAPGMPYPIPSPANANVVVEAGGRFLVNDASGIGSTTGGATWTMRADSVLHLGNTAAFLGSNSGLINSGQFVYEQGAIVRVEAGDIYKLSKFVGAEPNGEQVVYEIFNGNRRFTSQVNPFIVAAVGTPTIAPENITISNGGIITNDTSDRSMDEGRGKLILGNGAVLAGTTQTYLNIQEGFDLQAGANLTIGSTKWIDGVPKLGGVQFTGPRSNRIGAGATVTVIDGAQIVFGAADVYPDDASLSLPTAVTAFPSTGALALQPGNGSSLLLNAANFTEVIGTISGNGAIIGNQGGTVLGAGYGAATDFSFNGVFKSTNGQNPGLTKFGSTKMTLTGVSDSTGDLRISQGELSIGGTGQTAFATVRPEKGSKLTLDNSGNALANRLGGKNLSGQGGTIELIGHPTTPVTETVGQLNNGGSPVGSTTYLHVTPGGSALTTFTATTIENFQSAGTRQTTWVFRSPTMGNLPGTYSNASVYTPNGANLVNGLITATNPNFTSNGAFAQATNQNATVIGSPLVQTRPDILGDTSLTGKGVGFVTQDSTATGFRLLAASEYASRLRDNVSTNINVKLAGTTNTSGDTRVQTLTLAPGATMNITGTLPLNASASRVHLNGAGLFVQSGGAAASITGGANNYLQVNGGAGAYLHVQGDLNLGAKLFSDTSVVKTGDGTLNFGPGAASAWRGTLVQDGGTINLGANNSFYVTRGQNGFSGQSLGINGGVLNLGGNSQMINALNSSSALPYGAAAGGTITSATPANLLVHGGGTFSGIIGGSLSLDKTGNNTLLLTNDNTLTGSLKVRGGTLALQDEGRLGGVSGLTLNYGTLQIDNGYLAGYDNRLATGIATDMRGGQFTLLGRANAVQTESLGTVNALQGQNTLRADSGGSGAVVLNVDNLTRVTGSGTFVNFATSYGFIGAAGNDTTAVRFMVNNINGSPVTLTNGIIGGWAVTNGDTFSTNASTTGISTTGNTADGYVNYGSVDLSTASASTGSINFNDGTSRTIPAGAIVNSIRNAPGGGQTLTLSGALTIASGGLITNANQGITYTGGTITSNADSLYAWINQNTTTISSVITGGISLVKGGGASLTLSGANTYTGTTYVNAGTLTLNTASANGTTTVAVPADLVINNATVSESLTAQIKTSATVTLNGGDAQLLLRDAGSVSETFASFSLNGNGGSTNVNRPLIGRANAQATSSVSLTGATPITAVNENPNAIPTLSVNLGTLNFTGAAGTAQTLSITGSSSNPLGLLINTPIGTIPAGVAEGGLVKTGTGVMVLGGTNTFGSPASLTDVLNVQEGITRADIAGALGTNFANTTVQSGAGLAIRNVTTAGSIKLKLGSFLAPTEGNATLGTATTTAANQSMLNVAGNASVYLADYWLQQTNTGSVTVNGKLTGAGNINLVGVQITQGAGNGGAFVLANPILPGTAGGNDYTGNITANVNTIVQSQTAVVAPATRTSGNQFGAATLTLNGGRLRLREDGSATADVNNATVSYANTNLTLTADSFLDANRQTSTTATGNIVNLGRLTVPTGTTAALTVDSGNSYQVGITELDGGGTLVKGGNSILNINGYAGTFTGSVSVAGFQSMATVHSNNLFLNAATNNLTNLTVNGAFAPTAGTTINISNTLAVGNNAGAVVNGLNGVTTGSMTGGISIPNNAPVNFGPAGILRNDGILGSTGGGITLSPTVIQGRGVYQTVGQPITLGGLLADNGANLTRLKVSGDSIVNLTASAHSNTGGFEVQSGTLRIAPSGSAVLGGTIDVLGVAATSVATGANASQPVAAVSGTLLFEGSSVTHGGNINNSGLVRVTSGSTQVSGVIAGSAPTYVPGLLEGRLAGIASLDVSGTRVANPGNFGIKLEPRMAQTNLLTNNPFTGWSSNEMWVYTGEFFDADGTFTFAENVDDNALISIDGVNRIVSNANGTNQPPTTGPWNTATTTASSAGINGTTVVTAANTSGNFGLNFGMGPSGNGWHTIEIRVLNTAGGGGASGSLGFTNNFGLGVNVNGTNALDGSVFERPIDPGDGSLFRTKVGGKGVVQVGAAGNTAAVSLSAGGIAQTSNVTLNSNEVTVGIDANPATLTLTGAGASNADTLRVAGTKPVANVNVAAGSTMTVGTLDVAASGRVFVNTGAGAGGTIVVDTNHTLATASKVILEEGTLRLNGTGGSAGVEVQVFDNATLDVRGTLTGTAIIADGGKIMGTGTVAGLVNLSGGGTVAPGTSPGVLTVDSLVADAASTFQFELGGTVAGVGYDQLKVTGDTLNLDGAHLSLSVTGPLVQNSILNIVWNQGLDTDAGSFGNYLQGSNISLPGGVQVKLSYFDDPATTAVLEMSGGSSVSVQVTAVPEPGSAALLLGGLASVVAARRRRRNE